MSVEIGTVDWAAALADIEARIAKLQATADGIREIMASSGSVMPGGGPGGGVKPGTFLKMGIADATKKLLEAKRTKLSTQEVIEGLEQGGLPRGKYTTVYSVLARRQKQVGDIINMQGDWALAEWYPNYRAKGKGAVKNGTEEKTDETTEATA
jgi:hypothetical protein